MTRCVASSMGVRSAWWRGIILANICAVSFLVRLFAIIRYESVIHEFDPYFNYRATEFLTHHGLKEWWNWFDAASWYPLGRVVGQTLFPGLMLTGYAMWNLTHFLGFPFHIRDICVFCAPIFASFTCLSVYWLTKLATEALRGKENGGFFEGAGLLAAAFMAIVPSYISRSVAGSYDNEAVAIFALVFAFAVYCHALRAGTAYSIVAAALAYAYMVASWGGYVFITNTVAIHALATLLLGRSTPKHHAVYSLFHVLGTVLCLNIPFVGLGAVTSSEHLASHAVFLAFQAYMLYQFAQSYLNPSTFRKAMWYGSAAVATTLIGGYLYLILSGRTQFTGRSMTLLDPTYASKHNPIVASVSEHQPPTWYSYVFDLAGLHIFIPIGLWLLFRVADPGSGFLVGIYSVLAVYFSCVMMRLMLVFSPVACVCGGLALSHILTELRHAIFSESDVTCTTNPSTAKTDKSSKMFSLRHTLCILVIASLFYAALQVWVNGVYVAAVAYSSPSIVLSGYTRSGQRVIQDDFREAYYWLRHNSPEGARIMSWWDYGYQSAAMANKTVIVDNNTWNNTHIATVGRAFASPEPKAYEIISQLDVDYVFVVFGGFANFASDDVNKFAWMVKIAAGVYPDVKQNDFFTGRWSVGQAASPAWKNSLMYRLSFHRFRDGPTHGYDYVRREQATEVGKLTYFTEVYTTENWMVRVYKVNPAQELTASHPQSLRTM